MRIFRFALLALVLVLVALVSALTAMRFAIHGREVEVPTLIGKTPSEADGVLADRGLTLEVEDHFFSDAVREGAVVSQLPQPGSKVRAGWRVRAALSLGPPRATVPNVLGESSRAGEINVQRRGLEVGTVAVARLPGLPPDQVVAQSPPPDSTGMASPKVSLLLTAPEDAQAFVMPDFTGHRLADAAQTITAAGLRIGNISAYAPPALPPANASAPNAAVNISANASANNASAGNAAAVPNTSVAAGANAAAANVGAANSSPPLSASGVTSNTNSVTALSALPSKPPAPPTLEKNPRAIIVRQSPAAGQKVSPGVTVSLEVAL